MASASLTGNDTILLSFNDPTTLIPIVDLGNGDVAALTFPNELVGVTTGKNGNSLYALNETGNQADLVLRVLRGSKDDKTLNSKLATLTANFGGFILMNCQLIKKVGDGLGNITNDIYNLSGGIISKRVEATSNVEGNTDQSIAVYSLKFTNSPRSL